MGVLLATLCTRSIQTREGIIVKYLDCNAAVAGRDALAKTIYARLFDWSDDGKAQSGNCESFCSSCRFRLLTLLLSFSGLLKRLIDLLDKIMIPR